MANRNIQMKKKNKKVWDNLFPLTFNENVYNSEGIGLTEQLTTFENDILLKTDSKITDSENITNEKINNVKNDLLNKAPYHNVSHKTIYSKTYKVNSFITHIERENSEGEKVKLNYKIITGEDKTIVDFARKNNTSFASNAGMFGSDKYELDFSVIENGNIVRRTPDDGVSRDHRHYFVIKNNGDLYSYPTTTPVEELLTLDVKHATVGFTPMFKDGKKENTLMTTHDEFNEKHPRQIVIQTGNDDYYFLTVGGRQLDGEGKGVTVLEAYDIMMQNIPDIKFAYNLDGGGSAQSVVRGNLINGSYSKRDAMMGTVIRPRPDVLYLESADPVSYRDKNIEALSKDIIALKDSLRFIEGVQFGKWNPLLGASNVYEEESIVYSRNKGTYVRIGNIVIAFYDINVSDLGDATNDVRLRGFPGVNASNQYITSTVSRFDGIALADTGSVYLEHSNTGSASFKRLITDGKSSTLKYNALIKTSFNIIGTHIYYVDSNINVS